MQYAKVKKRMSGEAIFGFRIADFRFRIEYFRLRTFPF